MKKNLAFVVLILFSLSFVTVKATDYTSRTGPTTDATNVIGLLNKEALEEF